ncbi:MAG TPA: NAD(P)(+) transhydrogenase (Re/Si-specific) subunit beta [Candidatus Limnocylindria bacterium]
MDQLREFVPWIYLIAAITFIFGLKGLSGPTTAQLGNRVAAAGMLAAVIATFLEQQVAAAWVLVLPAIGIGTVIGFVGARQVPMTAMPQMVAIFNGAGGGAAALVSTLEYLRATGAGGASVGEVIAILLGLMIGAVSFSGSIIAFGKLQGLIDAKAFKYAGQQLVTGGLFAGMLLLALLLVADAAGVLAAPKELALGLVGLLALAFGVALVMPIGGADMPVVISLLNAYTGLAVAMASPTDAPPAPVARRYSSVETSAAAPPPAPLKMATICGIAVMGTCRAPTKPTTVPIAIAGSTRIQAAATCCSRKVAMTAASMPAAATRLPSCAVVGPESPFRPKMNVIAAMR